MPKDVASHQDGSTLIFWAVARGERALIETLCATDMVDLAPEIKLAHNKFLVLVVTDENSVSFEKIKYRHGERNTEGLVQKRYDHNIDLTQWALDRGYTGLLRLMFQQAVLAEISPKSQARTPISLASVSNDDGLLNFVLQLLTDNHEAQDDIFRKALIRFAFKYRIFIVLKFLFLEMGVDVNTRLQGDNLLLLSAAEGDHTDMMEFLLQQEGIDVNVRSDKNGNTPLHVAAMYGHQKLVKLLLDYNRIDPSCVANKGQTPLMSAASGCGSVLKKPLRQGVMSMQRGFMDRRR